MRRLLSVTAAVAATVIVSVPVRAADLLSVPLNNQPVPVADATSFDWSGFYAGVYGVGQTSPVGGTQLGLGLEVGANVQFDFVLIGGEVRYEGLGGGAGSTSYLSTLGRAGVLLADNTVLYATGGYGIDLGPPAESDVLIGGGLEFAVSDSMTIEAQYLHGIPVTGSNPKDQVTVGANFHF
jgi:outer membrane immunogenic protein